jgi:stress response protein YsnF
MNRTDVPAAPAVPAAARVTTRDGVDVTIDASFIQPHLTRIRWADDACVVLPAEMLQRQADGSLLIPLTAAELAAAAGREAVIPVVEEKISVSKRERETGRVVVHVTPHLRDETIDVALAEEHVEIERVPRNEFVSGPVAVRQEGDVTVVPVLEEVLVVEKRLMLREEIRLTRRREVRRHVEQVTLRTEEARVLRADGDEKQPG